MPTQDISGRVTSNFFKTAQKRYGTTVLVYFAEAQHWKIIYSVSKKIAPLAVIRNKCKRQLREAVRLADLQAGKPKVIVIVAKKELIIAPFEVILTDIQKLR